jgi:tRNA(fMet)-specific endonuclease VapC
MYLLDTDTIIYSLKGHKGVIRNLENHVQDSVKISIITLLELYYGAYKSERVSGNLAKIKTIESSLDIIPVGKESAEIFGRLKASSQKKGTPLDDFDLIIASCALANNLVLVTNNTKHFKRIEGLKLDNWTD